ncbi:MAG: amidohydrolase family protein, partial [Alphaproteobacteria bacterium]
ADQTNVSLKISGIGEAGHPWTTARQETIVRECINIFGVDRCMFASNYPVDRLVGEFKTIFKGFLEATGNFSLSDRGKLFYGNARKRYAIR